MKMILPLSLCATCCALLAACSKLETAPEGQRAATPPSGSTDGLKPWNAPTQQEAEAMLGPLGTPRR